MSSPSSDSHLASKPTLGYWKIRGLASHIRMLLHFCQVDFHDVAYEQHGAPDFSRHEWLAVKFTLPLAFPNLPYFLDGDVKLTQSVAIFNHVMRRYGRAQSLHIPHGTVQEAEYDMYLHTLADFADAIASVAYSPNYAQLVDQFRAQTLPDWLARFAHFLGTKLFLLGSPDKPSPLDFFFFELLDRTAAQTPNCLDPHPTLVAYHTRIKSLPGLQSYFSSPAASWHVNNTVAGYRG
jgi:glutathione S-transferase